MTHPAERWASSFGVLIPVHNEPRLALLLKKFDFEATPHVVVVDDGSTDGSTAVTGQYSVTCLRHERRLGVGAAIRTGLTYLRTKRFEVAVIMAGNNKDDPADIPALLSAIGEGADYVQGSRYLASDRAIDTPMPRRIVTRAVAWWWSLRFRRRLTDVTNGFRAYRLALLDDSRIDLSQRWLDRYELEYYLHFKVLSLGYRYAEAPVWKRYPRDGGSTSKIRLSRDSWSLLRPFVLLTLGLRR
jgi:dolichol-phosphate mannosyltransferase